MLLEMFRAFAAVALLVVDIIACCIDTRRGGRGSERKVVTIPRIQSGEEVDKRAQGFLLVGGRLLGESSHDGVEILPRRTA